MWPRAGRIPTLTPQGETPSEVPQTHLCLWIRVHSDLKSRAALDHCISVWNTRKVPWAAVSVILVPLTAASQSSSEERVWTANICADCFLGSAVAQEGRGIILPHAGTNGALGFGSPRVPPAELGLGGREAPLCKRESTGREPRSSSHAGLGTRAWFCCVPCLLDLRQKDPWVACLQRAVILGSPTHWRIYRKEPLQVGRTPNLPAETGQGSHRSSKDETARIDHYCG